MKDKKIKNDTTKSGKRLVNLQMNKDKEEDPKPRPDQIAGGTVHIPDPPSPHPPHITPIPPPPPDQIAGDTAHI